MWDLPGSGTELVSPALAGGFFTTEPPEKPCFVHFFCLFVLFCPFLIGVLVFLLRFKCYLYILDTSIFYQICVLKFFSPFHILFFHIDHFFCCAEAFLFDVVLFIFVFVSLAWEDRAKKQILLRPMSNSMLLVFFSRSFKISCFMFEFLIHFSLFLYVVWENSLVRFWQHVAVQFSPNHLLGRLSFPHCVYLPPFL